jgi:hypothetical protein
MKELFDIKRQENLGGLEENKADISTVLGDDQEALEKHQYRIQ